MTTKQFNVDFFTVEVPPQSGSFEDAVMADSSSADDESRCIEIAGYPVRLQEAYRGARYIKANITKIRMGAVPMPTHLNGDVEPLDLDDDEGLGEETAFAYDIRLKVIAVQRNKYGVSAAAIETYFRTKHYGGAPEFSLNQVVSADAINKFRRLRQIRKLRFAIAGVQAGGFWGADVNPRLLKRLVDEWGAPKIEVEVSMSRSHGSLDLQAINRWVSGLRNLGANTATAISITGREGADDALEVIDLITDRLVSAQSMALDANRTLPAGGRMQKMVEALEQKRPELERVLGGRR